MRVLIYDAHSYDQTFMNAANQSGHEFVFTAAQLDPQTATMAQGFDAVCLFVNDQARAETLTTLHKSGVKLIVQR